jgi:hypothetical protein
VKKSELKVRINQLESDHRNQYETIKQLQSDLQAERTWNEAQTAKTPVTLADIRPEIRDKKDHKYQAWHGKYLCVVAPTMDSLIRRVGEVCDEPHHHYLKETTLITYEIVEGY